MSRSWGRLVLLLAFLGAGCSREEGLEPAGVAVQRPDRVVQDFELTETHDGVLEWTLRADEARTFRNAGETRLSGVRMQFVRADGSVRSRLIADNGTIKDKTGDMHATGNVVLVSAEGDRLTTDDLWYEKGKSIIRGPGPVRIEKPDRVLTGTGFRAKPDLSEYEVNEDVHIELVDRDGSIELDR